VATLPTDPYAQRETRVIFDCVDNVTGRPFKIGIPCPDLSEFAAYGTDEVNLLNVDVLAYTTAVNTFANSPEGNACTVVRGKITGVNN